MGIADVILRWVAITNATSITQYRIESDKATSGVFVPITTQAATDRGDGAYGPNTTMLFADIGPDETAISVSNNENLVRHDFIAFEREMVEIQDAGSAGSVVEITVIRGQAGTMAQTHAHGIIGYKAHESFVDGSVNFGSRSVIRYRVIAVNDDQESIALELVAVNPAAPATNNLMNLWGILEDTQGNPKSGITVELKAQDNDAFAIDTSETIYKGMATALTDADGYFSFFLRRDATLTTYTKPRLVIDPGGAGEIVWDIQTLPDQDAINYLLT